MDLTNISRRQFVQKALLSCAGILSAGATGSLFGNVSGYPKKIRPPNHSGRVLADLHAHPTLDSWNRRSPLAVKSPALARMVEKMFNQTKVKWKTCHQAGVDSAQ